MGCSLKFGMVVLLSNFDFLRFVNYLIEWYLNVIGSCFERSWLENEVFWGNDILYGFGL